MLAQTLDLLLLPGELLLLFGKRLLQSVELLLDRIRIDYDSVLLRQHVWPARHDADLEGVGAVVAAIHGAVGDQRRSQLMVTQAGYERGGIPMAVRGRSDTALPFRGPSVEPSHAGRCPSFIDKHELFEVHPGLYFTPCAPCRLHVGALALVGVQGFF